MKKKAIVLGSVLLIGLSFSCSKKSEEVCPVYTSVKGASEMSNKEFADKMYRLAEDFKPVFTKNPDNSITFTSSKQSGTIYFTKNSTEVRFTNAPAAKFTVAPPVITTKAPNVYTSGSNSGSGSSGSGEIISGAQQTIIIEINASNVDRFSTLMKGNLFTSLFDTTTTGFFGGNSNSGNYVFAPKLNTDSLPSGAVSLVTVPMVTVLGDGKDAFNKGFGGSGNILNAKLVRLSNNTGPFELVQDSVVLAELAPGFSMLFSGPFNKGNKLVYNGTTYEGFAVDANSSEINKPAFFNFLFGMGAGSEQKVSGIQIGWGIDNQGQKAVLLIGVFGDIAISN